MLKKCSGVCKKRWNVQAHPLLVQLLHYKSYVIRYNGISELIFDLLEIEFQKNLNLKAVFESKPHFSLESSLNEQTPRLAGGFRDSSFIQKNILVHVIYLGYRYL